MSVADFLLKLDGIEGECQDLKHQGELQISTYRRGRTSPREVGSGRPSGEAIWDDAQFTMRVDKSFPKLLQACGQNQILKKVVLTCRKAGGAGSSGQPGQEYLIVTLTDVMISSCRLHGSPDADPNPVVEFSMNYATIQEDYCAQATGGFLKGAVSYSDKVGKGT